MKVRTEKGIVQLRWYDYCTDHVTLLKQMQRLVPNQDVELKDGTRIKMFNLMLDTLSLRDLNPIDS